jgi:hypothetical protein
MTIAIKNGAAGRSHVWSDANIALEKEKNRSTGL